TIVADGEPLQDHGGGQIRFRLCGGLDAEGSVDLPRRSAQERRKPAGHRTGRSVLRRSAENGRTALGHIESDRKTGSVTADIWRKNLKPRSTIHPPPPARRPSGLPRTGPACSGSCG